MKQSESKNHCKNCGKEIPEGEELCEECREQEDLAGTWMLQESGVPIWG